MFTSRTSPKVRRIAADPRVALSVEEPVGVHERWVTIEGTASISVAGTVDLLTRLARRYYQSAQAEQAVASWTVHPEMWVTLTITPIRIRSSN